VPPHEDPRAEPLHRKQQNYAVRAKEADPNRPATGGSAATSGTLQTIELYYPTSLV